MQVKENAQYSENNETLLPKEENSCAKIDSYSSRENSVNSENSEDIEENTVKTSKAPPKKKALKFNPVTGVVAIVVAAVAAIGVFTTKSPKINSADYIVGDNYYAYTLQIENPDSVELKLKIYNDYYKKETNITSGEVKGIVEDLAPNTYYKIEVKGSQGFGEKTFYSSKFKTLKEAQDFETNVSATYKQVKNILYYTLEIKDFLHYYTNYKIFIKVNSEVLPSKINGQITDEQSIPLQNILAKEFSLFVTADTSNPTDTANNITNKTVYSALIKNDNFNPPIQI